MSSYLNKLCIEIAVCGGRFLYIVWLTINGGFNLGFQAGDDLLVIKPRVSINIFLNEYCDIDIQ